MEEEEKNGKKTGGGTERRRRGKEGSRDVHTKVDDVHVLSRAREACT